MVVVGGAGGGVALGSSLEGAYYLQPPDAHVIFFHDDIQCAVL